jgi:hypothetical protein
MLMKIVSVVSKAVCFFRKKGLRGLADFYRDAVLPVLFFYWLRIMGKWAVFCDQRIFRRVEIPTSEQEKPIYIFCLVWGEEYLDYLFNFGIPSLLQEGNVPRLVREGCQLRYFLYVKEQEVDLIRAKYASGIASIKEYAEFNFEILEGFPERIDKTNKGPILREAITRQISRCIEDRALFFMAMPYYVYGNKSVYNAVKIIEGKSVCLAVAHPHITKHAVEASLMFDLLKRRQGTIENDELVDFSFGEGLHNCIRYTFDDASSNYTYAGISIRKIDRGLYSVIHNMPNVIVANFTQRDLKFFDRRFFNDWDKWWPRWLLKENRLKVSGSSDLVFYAKIWVEQQPELKGGLRNNDHVVEKRRHLQYYVNNAFCCVWRGRSNTVELLKGELNTESYVKNYGFTRKTCG